MADPHGGLVILIFDRYTHLTGALTARCPEVFADPTYVRQALTEKQASLLFDAYQDRVDVILIGSLPARDDVYALIEELRARGFEGPVMPIATDPEVRGELERRGCARGCSWRDSRELGRLVREAVAEGPAPGGEEREDRA
jgi:hypothetical protein